MSNKIIFLDIDGVLLPRKSYFLPENERFIKLFNEGFEKHSRKEIALSAKFDKTIISLINRLCEMTGAKIVPHTNWRRTVGIDETIEKIIKEGIKEEYIHENPRCTYRMTSGKDSDIMGWLYDNRLTDVPTRPKNFLPFDKGYDEKVVKEYNEKLHNHGYEYLIIDDEQVGYMRNNQILTDFDEGFAFDDYKVACAFFDKADPMAGVIGIEDVFLDRIKLHIPEKIDYIKWLHSNKGRLESRSLLLSKSHAEENARVLSFYGKETKEGLHEKYCEMFWKELEKEYPLNNSPDSLFDDF